MVICKLTNDLYLYSQFDAVRKRTKKINNYDKDREKKLSHLNVI